MKTNNIQIITEFLDHLETIRGFSKHTLRSYRFDLNNFSEFCMEYDDSQSFLDLDHTTIQFYLHKQSKKGLNSKTLARRLASIKSLYKYLTAAKIVDVNISKGVKTPKTQKELPHYLSLKEAAEILTLPEGNGKTALRDRIILELFYATGIRISELVKIKLNDIKMEEGIIYILGKGGKERIVMMGSDAQKTLRDYMSISESIDGPPSPFLFPAIRPRSGELKPIGQRTVFNIVKKYLKQVSDDEKLSPHSLRHSFATHLLNNGADLMAIKEMLGHESLSSTQIYTHLQPEKLKKDYNQAHPHAK